MHIERKFVSEGSPDELINRIYAWEDDGFELCRPEGEWMIQPNGQYGVLMIKKHYADRELREIELAGISIADSPHHTWKEKYEYMIKKELEFIEDIRRRSIETANLEEELKKFKETHDYYKACLAIVDALGLNNPEGPPWDCERLVSKVKLLMNSLMHFSKLRGKDEVVELVEDSPFADKYWKNSNNNISPDDTV